MSGPFPIKVYICVMLEVRNKAWQRCTNKIIIRGGTNTPSDEYDSYREYRVANTNMYSRIQWFANWMHEWRRSFIRQIHVGYIIHNTETPIKTCNVLLAWEPPFNSFPLTLWVKAACLVLAIEVLLHARVLTLICACPIILATINFQMQIWDISKGF